MKYLQPAMKNFYLCLSSLLFFLLIQPASFGQTVRINEIMTSNSSFINDDDGDYSDWIELFNPGTTAVQLEGWGLTDNAANPYKWKFPEYLLEPGAYALVWASGKNRAPKPGEWVNGLIREVWWNVPGSSIQRLTDHPEYPDNPDLRHRITGIFEAPSNEAENYGQRIYGLLKAPVTGEYTFWIASADYGQLWLGTDESPESVSKIAEVSGWTNSREWDRYPGQKSEPVYLEEGKFYHIMALMKKGTGGDNLSVRWQWPDGSMEEPISDIHLFWNEPMPMHTNFSLNAEGEDIILTNKSGEIADQFPPVRIPANISYGVTNGDIPGLNFFDSPTPGEKNSDNWAEKVLQPPVFSHSGGFYDASFNLELSSSEPGATIIYTLDGSNPLPSNLEGISYQYKNQYPREPGTESGPLLTKTFSAHTYTQPLEIYDRTNDENNISTITTTFDENPRYIPDYKVEKAFVVKARTVKDGALSSETITHTFFVNENGENPYTLPLIAISAQEDELFGYEKGIYTAGIDFDNWRAANPEEEVNNGVPANYSRRGDLWEYPASFELFTPDGTKHLGQNIGLRIHGGWSRAHPYKSLRIYGRNLYGESTLNYKFFEEQDDQAYKRLILRNSGTNFYSTLFTDGAIQRMIRHLNVETQAFQPSVLFLNGEYWGLHHIRERYDKHYLARKFNIEDGKFDLLDNNKQVVEGDIDHYVKTLDYITEHGVEEESHYQYINTRISIESYIDYMVAELFIANTDWPSNNTKYWRLKTDEFLPDAGPGKDGRWRWIVVDTDFGMGMYNPPDINMLELATKPDGTGYPNPPWATFLFRSLLENEKFKTDFITRYRDQLNTAFLPEITKPVIEEIQLLLEPEFEKHYKRWKSPSNISTWRDQIKKMYDFADQRPAHAIRNMQEFFELEEDYQLTVNISDSEQGYVIVNTIPLVKETRGVPESPYPWSGTYFKKLPLRLEAVPEKGYEFVMWESGTETYNEPVLEIIPEGDRQFTAVFQKAEKEDILVHYWNFNNTESLLVPTYTLLAAAIHPAVPSDGTSELTNDTGQGFEGENARFGNEAGNHLRVNYPLGVTLTLDVPTTGFSKIKAGYETRRSGQGAGIQVIEYSTDGNSFTKFRELTVEDDNPQLVLFDFSDVETANNNPDFKIRITFAQGEGSNAGNNRFDNITLEGIPDDGLNLPPAVVYLPEDRILTEGEDFSIALNQVFNDPDGDQLQFSVSSSYPQVVTPTLAGTEAAFTVKQRGESLIKIIADDGSNTPVELSFRVMVFPQAFMLAEEDFSFDGWDQDAPEMTFPENMLFLQSNMSDPAAADPLEYVYYIPAGEYHSDDALNVGFPYRNTRRTRLNGLDEQGIAFINTGRDRDLGGALVAINTTGTDEVHVSWLSGTILQNSRQYGLVLQYRTGTSGSFTDVPGSGYTAATDGDQVNKGPIKLPEQLLNQEYVQLLWRYHFLNGTSGPRAQLRIDDILIAATPSVPVSVHPTYDVPADQLQVYPNPFSDQVRLELTPARAGNAEIGLYDLSGRKVLSVYNGHLPSEHTTHAVNAGHLPSGTYILTVRTESGVSRQKLIKK